MNENEIKNIKRFQNGFEICVNEAMPKALMTSFNL